MRKSALLAAAWLRTGKILMLMLLVSSLAALMFMNKPKSRRNKRLEAMTLVQQGHDAQIKGMNANAAARHGHMLQRLDADLETHLAQATQANRVEHTRAGQWLGAAHRGRGKTRGNRPLLSGIPPCVRQFLGPPLELPKTTAARQRHAFIVHDVLAHEASERRRYTEEMMAQHGMRATFVDRFTRDDLSNHGALESLLRCFFGQLSLRQDGDGDSDGASRIECGECEPETHAAGLASVILKHLTIWWAIAHADTKSDDVFLVLEDDAALHPDFNRLHVEMTTSIRSLSAPRKNPAVDLVQLRQYTHTDDDEIRKYTYTDEHKTDQSVMPCSLTPAAQQTCSKGKCKEKNTQQDLRKWWARGADVWKLTDDEADAYNCRLERVMNSHHFFAPANVTQCGKRPFDFELGAYYITPHGGAKLLSRTPATAPRLSETELDRDLFAIFGARILFSSPALAVERCDLLQETWGRSRGQGEGDGPEGRRAAAPQEQNEKNNLKLQRGGEGVPCCCDAV